MFARAIHLWARRNGRFVAVNAAAIPSELAESQLFGHVRGAFSGAHKDSEGAFCAADGGTLLLDEIGELPSALQPKLLRALEERQVTAVGASHFRKVEIRLVAATNLDLFREVEAGTFRRDLLARLAGAVIRIPPLRSRLTDILLLARTFVDRRNWVMSAGFAEGLLLHPWPMNIRELRTAMKRVDLLSDAVLERSHLAEIIDRQDGFSRTPVTPSSSDSSADSADSVRSGAPLPPRPSPEELREVLARLGGNISRTAAHFRRDVKQIYRWIERDSIDISQYRTAEAKRAKDG
jgi:transcriptional regulator with GAF, ATPase, and Fis domain